MARLVLMVFERPMAMGSGEEERESLTSWYSENSVWGMWKVGLCEHAEGRALSEGGDWPSPLPCHWPETQPSLDESL